MKIGDFCKTGAGGTPLKSNRSFYEGGSIPWLLSGEVGNRDITETKKFITQEGLDGSSAKMFPVNTVLIAMYGATAGEVGILRCEASTNQAVCGIFPNKKVLPEYLYYFFLNHKDLLIAQAVGNAQPNISQAKIKNTDIPLPPIPEQKRIVALLDTVFADLEQTRAKTEQNLKNARELFDSYMQQVFSQKGEGWVEKKLIEVCVLQRGFDLPKRLRTKGKYPLVSSSGITDTHVEAKVTGPGVVTGRSGSIGNVFYIKEDFWPLNTALYIKEFHGNNEKFISWLLRYFDLSRFTSGAGVPTLNRNFVHDELVNIPVSVDEQFRLVTEIEKLQDEVDKVIAIYKKKLVAIDELKKSILQKAFSGELTHD